MVNIIVNLEKKEQQKDKQFDFHGVKCQQSLIITKFVGSPNINEPSVTKLEF